MKFSKKYSSYFSFTDLLFNTLLGFVLLYICSFLLIAPISKKNISTKAEIVITSTWDSDSADDVDIWVEDPLGNVVYYQDKSRGLMHLDKDDLGQVNDQIVMPNGEVVILNINQEIVSIRGFIPGEWTVNVHMYKKNSPGPTTVNVVMEKLNPTVKPFIVRRVVLDKAFQEITIARFTMDASGNILDMSKLYKPLANKYTTHVNPNIGGVP